MSPTKLKQLTTDAPVPQSREEANQAVLELGNLQRERARLETEMNDRLAAIKSEYDKPASKLASRINKLVEGVRTWATANRTDMTKGTGRKTVRLATGEISWRIRPPRVSLRGKDKIIEACERLGLVKFIRTSKDVDKNAMLADPATARTIQGVSVASEGEDFIIKPDELELEEVA